MPPRRSGCFGFCVDTALHVTTETPEEDEVWLLEQLDILLDRSLLVVARRTEHPRYRMLETMREYALEQLHALDEIQNVRQRHAHAMRAALKQAVKERDSDRQLDEVANIRAALAYALATPGEGAVAFEWTGALAEPARFASEGKQSMPLLVKPATETEVQVRKPSGHAGH